jgi:HEAT repeat protein
MDAVIDAVARMLGLPRFVARAALAAATFHAVFVGGVTVIKSGTNALFLSRADPSLLPLLYAAVAVVVTLATTLLARLITRRPLPRLLIELVSVVAGVVVGGCVVVEARVPGATGFLYVMGEAAATAGSVLFWSRVMEGFSPRDQKRVVGLVGGGGMLGAALGGLTIRAVVDLTGVVAPMIAAATLWVVALPLLRAVPVRVRDDELAGDAATTTTTTASKATATTRPSMRNALRYLTSAGYPRAVAALVVLLAANGAATDFVFRAAAARSTSETGMAGLFGLLNAVVGGVVVLLQVGMTARLLQALGVFLFAAVVPTLLAVLAAVHAAGGRLLGDEVSFALLVGLKGVEMAGAYSLYPTAVALLYNPMPVDVRAQARTLIDGAIKKTGAAAAGLLLGALAAGASVVGAWTVLVLALGTLGLLPLLRRLYLDALGQRLGGPTSTTAAALRIDTADADTRRALERQLRSDDADAVIAALDVLGPHYVPEKAALLALIGHADERVRIAALARVPVHPDPVLAAQLLAIAGSPGARRPRAEAVRAMTRAQPGRAADAVARFLDDEDPGVVCAALEVCLRTREDAAARARLDGLLAGILHADPPLASSWRRELARLLGALHAPRYTPALVCLLDDGEDGVRTLAIAAAARSGDPALVPPLVRHLGDRRTRAAVATALVRFGDEAVPALSAALDDTALGLAVRVHVPRLLQRVGTEAAARALLFSNPRDNAYLQARIARALVAIASAHPGIVVDRERTDEAIGRRLVAYAAYDTALRDLAMSDEPALRLIRHAVSDRRRQNLGIALDLLALHRDQEPMLRVRAGLLADDRQAQIDALELLDATLVADPLRSDFLALLDPRGEAPTPRPARAWTRLALLCESRDPLLRGIAQATVARVARPADAADVTNPRGTALPASFELLGDDMPDEIVDRLFLLEDVELFSGLDADDLLAIAQIATPLSIPAGQHLFHEGDVGSTRLYILVDGIVEMTRRGRPVLTLRAGEAVGQVSFLDRGPQPVTARVGAGGAARFLVVERDAFFDLLADRTSLMRAFFDVVARRLRALVERAGA